MKVVTMDEGGEIEVGEAGGEGEGELDYHVIDVIGVDIRDDEVRGGGDEDIQDDEDERDHYMPSIRLVDTNLLEAESEALELTVSVMEATCVRLSTRQ
ncbi:hypothetical protein BHM03_00042489 [Ensete ventricosum]|nr:hypothetical protein BHM03_00042489 [Ensete ventricosum]